MASARLNGRFSIDERNINGSHLMEMRATRVYQRGRSRPARAPRSRGASVRQSVSKRPFPTSQSLSTRLQVWVWSVSKGPFPTSQSAREVLHTCAGECIKEAVPDQPEPQNRRLSRSTGVYQRGRSRPARAVTGIRQRPSVSVSKRPFPTSQSRIYVRDR